MEGNLLLVSSDETFYGTYADTVPFLTKYLSDVWVGDPSPEQVEQIQEFIAERQIRGVITRGSWTVILKKALSIPVFPFKIDAADVYRSLHALSNEGFRRVGIVIFTYITERGPQETEIEHYRFAELCLYVAHVNRPSEIDGVIQRMCAAHQVEYVLGDVEAVRAARRSGVARSGVIPLNARNLADTAEQALYMIRLIEMERWRREYIDIITNLISEATISFDRQGHIIRHNSHAAALMPPGASPATIEALTGIPMEELFGQPANKLIRIRGKSYIMNLFTSRLYRQTFYTLVLNSKSDIQEIELSLRTQTSAHGLKTKHHFSDIAAFDRLSVQTVDLAKKYAGSQAAVLLSGETGTGKELFAGSIHNESPRRDGPFVAINCAALAESLIESELFGYEKGAFTGASRSGKRGLFELAHGGTIFLDEVGELPLRLQSKLLRVLQEHEIMHIGGSMVIPVDVRVISATNRDLRAMIAEGTFRSDLFYRLSLLEIRLPPLRERPADIIPLFLRFLNAHLQKNGFSLFWKNEAVFEPLLRYRWPGNIRELENFAERVVLLSEQSELTRDFIASLIPAPAPSDGTAWFHMPETDDLRLLESRYVHFLMRKFGGDRDAVCEYLHISKPTLWRKLRYGEQADADAGPRIR